MRSVKTVALVALAIVAAVATQASEVGHFSPGLPNIRDFFVPKPGFYGIIYNYAYTSDQLNDRNGDEVSTVTITIPPNTVCVGNPIGHTRPKIDRHFPSALHGCVPAYGTAGLCGRLPRTSPLRWDLLR